LEPINVTLTVANGQQVPVQGRANVQMTVGGGSALFHDFIVAAMEPQKVLGYDFFLLDSTV
jgi:hypothetical protein